MKKAAPWLIVIVGALFVWAPVAIANAPYEATMGLVQKIFYFHVSAWIAMYAGIAVCGVSSAIYLFKGWPRADRIGLSAAELIVLFGMMGLVSGPLWGRKAWGVWWVWDARLTMALLLVLIFWAYLIVRWFGGPGSDKLAAAVGIFGTAVAPFVYVSVNLWRTIHPLNSVVPTLKPSMMHPFALSAVSFLLMFVLLLWLRVSLADRQAELDDLYLAQED